MRRNAVVACCFLLLAVLVIGTWTAYRRCSPPPRGRGLAKVTCRLKWLHQSQFAGNYVAVAKEFYKDEGIECVLQPGGQDFNAIKLVASGSEDFGVCGADQVLIAKSKGIPVIALAVIFQKSPVCFFAKKKSGISGPQDFVGRRVAMQYGTNVRTEYVAMMKNVGVDLKTIIEIPSRHDMQRFFEGQVDVWNGYVINEVLVARRSGFEVKVISPSDYGVDMYADCLFTTEERVASQPELVRGFVRATVRGWEYAIAHPEEAVKIVLTQDAKLSREHESQMLGASVPLILARSARERGIGWMEPDVWSAMSKTLHEQGVTKTRVDASTAFTNRFLELEQ